MADPRVIRPSSLVAASDCSRRWAAQHLTAEVEAAGYRLRTKGLLHVGAAVGSGVHAAMAFTLDEKKRTGKLGPEGEAVDRAQAEFDERAAEEGLSFDDVTGSVGVARLQIQRMSRAYRRHIAPKIEPLLVETRLVADIGGGWLLSGQGDVLAGDPQNDVRDTKTGRSRRANGAQYGAYAMIFQAHGFATTGIIEDFVARVRPAVEQPVPQSTQIDVPTAIEEAASIMSDIQRSVADFERRVADGGQSPHMAFRANPASTLCSAQFCRAWGTNFCRAHLR